jgi:glycine/D-amino acid oxidase-like deaminating enzyme
MAQSILVLGAGIVGTCTALHLQQRGFDVVLVDRRAPGQETSFGNAGLIQREAVEPYAFPQEPGFLLNAALGRGAAVHWHARGLWQMAGALRRYWGHSRPAAHAQATLAYSQLIAHATIEHGSLMAQVEAQTEAQTASHVDLADLVKREGFRFVFRTPQALDEALHANGAKVCSLAPGVIDTDMQVQLRGAAGEAFPDQSKFLQLKAQGQLSTPAQAAEQVLRFLARPDFGREPVADVRG